MVANAATMQSELEYLGDPRPVRVIAARDRSGKKSKLLVGTLPCLGSRLFDRMRKAPSFGTILCLLASFCLSVAFMLVKFIKGVDPVFFVTSRGILQVSLFNSVTLYQAPPLDTLRSTSTWIYLLSAGVLVSLGQVLGYGTLDYIPISDSTSIVSSAPVFVSIFARVLLKEKCDVRQVLTQAVAVTGVLLICRPTFLFGGDAQQRDTSSADHVTGTCLAVASCVSLAGLYVTLRKLTRVPTSITNSACGLVTVVFGLGILGARGRWQMPACGLESVLLVLSACAGTTGMLLLVCATQVENAGPLSVVRTSEIIFAFIWQKFLLDHSPPWTTIVGAGLVVSSVVLVGTRNWTCRRLLDRIVGCCARRGGQRRTKPSRTVSYL